MSRRLAAIEELRGMLFDGIDIAKKGMTEATSPAALVALSGHVGRCEALRAVIEDMECQTDEEWEVAHLSRPPH